MKEQLDAIKQANDGKLAKYAWPGGYPLFYGSGSGLVFCYDCAIQEDAKPEISWSEINWENDSLYCEGCGERIKSAYAEN